MSMGTFTWFLRKINYLKLLNKQRSEENSGSESEKIPDSIELLNKKLKQVFSECSDFILREITLAETGIKISIAYVDGLIDNKTLNDTILTPLMDPLKIRAAEELNKSNAINILNEKILNTADLKEVKDLQKSINFIMSGDAVIFVDGSITALRAGTRGGEARGIEEPDTEAVVRGPREGFVESLRINTALLRRKIKNPNLKTELITLGEQTNTDICICYIKGIANDDVVKTVRRRLKKIKTDAILESGYLEEFIEDAPFSIFPTVGNSEKPDIVAAKILEGRVAILCDGTPFVLTVPYLFVETLQTSEDYYSRSYFSSLLRWLRIFALYISLAGPALYLGVLTFHHTVIPLKLLLTFTASREGIPFSPFTETLIMGITFEILREAGVRMPRPIGQAISIVGAIVIGEASVRAGLVSNPIVIVTSVTAISSFISPSLQGTTPILRLILLVAANILGYLGILFVVMAVIIHMCSLRSFGVPYTAPFAPLSGMDLKDTVLRVPVWLMLTRPGALTRQSTGNAKYRMAIDFRKKED